MSEITITADDKSSKYKSDIAELTYQVGGDYVDGDDLGVTISTSADSTSPVGEYDITVDWNENPNYTAKLSKGKYTITKSDLAISASGYSGTYDGKAHGITVEVGDSDATVYYGTSELNSSNYNKVGSTTNPKYTNAGEYTVYYFVDSKNYEPTPISGSKNVSIAKADPTFAAPTAKNLTYNGYAQELVNAGSATGGTMQYRTDIVTVPMEDDVDITMPSGNVNSNLTVAKGTPNIAVGGLDEEAEAIRLESGAKDVTVSMFIESKTESKAANAEKIKSKALPNQDLEYLDIRVESTVDSVKKTMDKTHTVLEIAIPYDFGGKESVMLYRYHDGKAASLTENDSEKDGTYYLDKENGYIHLYTDRFSTYAIGYIQCYNITGIVKCGSYKGKATVTLLKKETNGEETQSAQSILDLKESKGVYTFDHVQKGTYILMTEWTDGEKTSVLKEEIEVK